MSFPIAGAHPTPAPAVHHAPPAHTAVPGNVPKHARASSESADDSDSDDDVEDLMFLLDDAPPKVQKKVNNSEGASSSAAMVSSPAPATVKMDNESEGASSSSSAAMVSSPAPATVKVENFDSRNGVWIQFRDGTAFGKYPTILVPQSMMQYDVILVSLVLKNSTREIPMPKFFDNTQVSDHVKMCASHLVSKNKYWVRPASLDTGRIVFKKKTWALGKTVKTFVNSDTVKFHMVLVPFHKGELKYDLAESTPDFEVRSKEQGTVTRARQGLTGAAARPRKRRRTAESEAKRIALESVRSDIASQHNDIAKKHRTKQDNDERLRHILELTLDSTEAEVMAIHNLVRRYLTLQGKQTSSSYNSFNA